MRWIFLFLLIVAYHHDVQSGELTCDGVTDIPVSECEALIDLYERTDGENWQPVNWSAMMPPCQWIGVTCLAGHVIELRLEANSLNGTLPPTLADLTYLNHLDLSANFLHGPLPPEIGNLPNLHSLNLNFNQFEGSIPAEMGNLTNLEELWLSDNDLSGLIPVELGDLSSLSVLVLGYNRLAGPIPPELGGLTHLQTLALADNQLNGVIPPELGTLADLLLLDLSSNQLNGPIPPELGDLVQVERFNLSHNQLSGPIPAELGNLSGLVWQFDLGYNSLNGRIPAELGNLVQVTRLDLSHNHLSGPLPPELSYLTALFSLYINNNQLSGPLPEALVMVDKLLSFDFSQTAVCIPYDPVFIDWLSDIFELFDSGVWCTPAVEIPVMGGSLTSYDGQVTVHFPANAFSSTTTVTYTHHVAAPMTSGHTGQPLFHLQAVQNGTPITQTNQPLTLTVQYTIPASAISSTIQLYRQEGLGWTTADITAVSHQDTTITAQTDRLTLYAVLGETHPTYLPLIRQSWYP